MTASEKGGTIHAIAYCSLAATIMAYGWGYRGTVGHEGGAMAPGAMLGMVLALASGRLEWRRRSAVMGLFAAAGWAWGGSLSYMEQTLYALSDSFPDVLYGYAMLVFLGGLWAGIGGAVLGLAMTEPRSELERLTRPFTAICGVFFAVYLCFFFIPDWKEACETFGVRYLHDSDWLAAAITLLVGAFYWLARPKDRPATAPFFWCAAAWWVGYLTLTQWGGLRLGPLHRSESWGGILGILVALIVYLKRRRNRAALMLCLYGILGGGLGFALAVFIRHPFAVRWGPISTWPQMPQWRIAEVSFGFLMGLAMALGVLRLLRGGLRPAEEDTPRAPLDVYAVFVILVALFWINFRRHAEPWLTRFEREGGDNLFGLPLWAWYCVAGFLATGPFLFALYRYLRGDRLLVPQSPFGKGTAVTLFLVWATLAGYTLDDMPKNQTLIGHLILWIPAALATWLLLFFSTRTRQAKAPPSATAGPSDPMWQVGVRYWFLWCTAPFILLAIAATSMAMQDGPHAAGRKRFGPEAYWRQTARLLGTWRTVSRAENLSEPGTSDGELPVRQLEFRSNRDVIATLSSGEVVADAHRWFLKNQYTWLHWYAKAEGHPERAEVPLQFRNGRLYVAWPPEEQDEGYLVFERIGD